VIARRLTCLDRRRHEHLTAVDVLVVAGTGQASPNPAQTSLTILDA
jgi:hypothetical protein